MSGDRLDSLKKLTPWNSRSGQVWVVALVAIIVIAAGFLFYTGAEWRDAIADRVEKDRKVGLEHQIRTCLWYAALVNLILSIGLLASSSWWVGNNKKLICGQAPAYGRFFWIALGVLVVAGATIRWPRMDLSLYNDEEYTFRRYVAGQFKDGEWKPVTWEKTAYFNKAGNNGIPYSLLARTFYDATDPAAGVVREVPLRMPAFLAGVLSIAVIGLLAAQSGSPTAGIFAASIAAFHPWHIRYSTEARAYGLVLLFAALALLAIYLGMQRRGWRWWILYAVSQFFVLYAYPGAVYFAVGLNLAAFTVLALKDRARLPRLIVANLLSAMLLAQAMAPAILQLVEALKDRTTLRGGIPPSWWADIASYLSFGMQWFDHAPDSPINPALARAFESHPFLTGLSLLAVAALFVNGCLRLARSGGPGLTLLIGSLLSVPLAWLHCTMKGNILHFWYVIYALPFFITALAFGLPSRKRSASITAGAAFLFWIATAQFPLRIYEKHPKEDFRGVIEAMRGKTYPHYDNASSVLTAGFWSEAGVYDPELLPLNSKVEFDAWLERARTADAAFVTFGRRELALGTHGEIVDELESKGQFTLVAEFPGLEDGNYTHYIYQLITSP